MGQAQAQPCPAAANANAQQAESPDAVRSHGVWRRWGGRRRTRRCSVSRRNSGRAGWTVWWWGHGGGGARRRSPAVRDQLLLPVAAGESAHVTRVRLDGVVASYYAAVPVRSDDGELLGFVGQERRINVNPRALPLMRGFIGPDTDF